MATLTARVNCVSNDLTTAVLAPLTNTDPSQGTLAGNWSITVSGSDAWAKNLIAGQNYFMQIVQDPGGAFTPFSGPKRS